ncbi:MAG: hypothetical protein KME54_15660 [Tolypothrix brevis GSE-NOS-MK-07-07A]|nr:hypothetical protein [Tolypothrix brevis GSE-NOS-MK-07-07A]
MIRAVGITKAIAFPDKSEVHLKTSPPTPLLAKERGDKAQLYRGEVIALTSVA